MLMLMMLRERRREQQLARESLLIETLIDTHLSHNLRCIQDTIRLYSLQSSLSYPNLTRWWQPVYPPLTGGIRATSSPACSTRSESIEPSSLMASRYSMLTATMVEPLSAESAGTR